MIQKFPKLSLIVATLFLFHFGSIDRVTAQEPDKAENDGPEVEQQSQEEIDQALENILKNLPKIDDDSDDQSKDGKDNPNPPNSKPNSSGSGAEKETDEKDKENVDPGIVVELQKQIDEIKARNQESTKNDLTTLKRLNSQLKVAKAIEQQFKKIPIKKTKRKESDSFIVANLEVKPKGEELEVSFQSTHGEKESIRQIFNYLIGTPAEGYRDYRIISRHNDSNVELALNGVRKDYDMAKEREKQFLEYIQQQQARLARVKASRRC